MELRDYADGIRGHYCIGRRQVGGQWPGVTWEYWNQTTLRWGSAGTVYNLEAALKKLGTLYREQARKKAPATKETP